MHSILSSAIAIWCDIPSVLLREHYRCHPKIASFCNQKFYQNQLIIMTEDHQETDVLALYYTAPGNHARGHLNQRQIDTIIQEVLPQLTKGGHSDIGIIAPYRDQVAALSQQVHNCIDIDTVHKFQGREKEAIVLSSTDNVISDFLDDPHMLNVAVSRATHNLSVVLSVDERNANTNWGDLAKYISYNNFEVVNSTVFSVFDLLYKGYSKKRKHFLLQHKRISEYDSENLIYAVIENVLHQCQFQKLDCVAHTQLSTLIRNYNLLTEEEQVFASNPLTHTDFLLFNRMDKRPVLVIEVDGYRFHQEGTRQAERDAMKNSILEKCSIPILRLRTNESGEEKRLIENLVEILHL